VDGRADPDVLVVGGGPAGCAAALWAARHGLGVELIHRPDRRAYRPGETLPPAIEPLLRQLGAEDALLGPCFPRTTGHMVTWGGSERFEPYGADAAGPWLGFQACRQTLDRGLREAARVAGVAITESAGVAPAIGQDGTLAGVRLSRTREIRARVVVDAAGSGHWLARRLGLEIRRFSPRLVSRFGLVGGGWPGTKATPSLVADADGWTWSAPVESGTVAWVRLRLSPGQAAAIAPAKLAHLTPRSRIGGADVTWRSVPASAGPGYVLVGDAAFVLDPLSSHGVLHAVLSGMMAGEMIAKSLLGGVPPAVTAAAYRRWSSARFATDVERLRELYAELPGAPAWILAAPAHEPMRVPVPR
jgi:flavin-dependent dehydrogenase